jgi:hypothetical protein
MGWNRPWALVLPSQWTGLAWAGSPHPKQGSTMVLGGGSNGGAWGTAQWSSVASARWWGIVRRMDFAFSSKLHRGEVAHSDACGWGRLSVGCWSAQGGAVSDRGSAATSRPCTASWASSHFELVGRTMPVGRPGYMAFPIIQRFSNAPSLKFKNIIFQTFRIYETFWGGPGDNNEQHSFLAPLPNLSEFWIKNLGNNSNLNIVRI